MFEFQNTELLNLGSRVVGSLRIKIRQIPKLGVLADFRNPGLVYYKGNFYPRFFENYYRHSRQCTYFRCPDVRGCEYRG